MSIPLTKYMDLSIVNGDPYGQSNPIPLNFYETRTTPFLDDPDQYLCAVLRFSIDCLSLPVILCQPQVGQANINLLNYSFTLKWKDYEYQQFIIFEPQDMSVSLPKAPLETADYSTGYYFLYSYQWFIQMCNTALQSCFNGLKELVLDDNGEAQLPTILPPWMIIDPSTLDVVINADMAGFDESLSEPISLYMNSSCYSLFNAFQVVNYGNSGITNGKNYRITLKDINSTNILDLTINNIDYMVIQSYPENEVVSLWNPVESVVICSSTLPIEGTYMNPPKVYNSSTTNYNTGQNLTIPILTDMSVPSGRYRPNIAYSPYFPRLISMFSHQPQNIIGIEIMWRDSFNNMYPINLNSNSTANLKLGFFHKSMYTEQY
jgi:hypothetical protein